MAINQWMSWEGGVDLCGTSADSVQPTVLVHVARMVNTPIGSAPAGMILYHPDPAKPPELMGFISPNLELAAYFGPNIFQGTPFEEAPGLEASIAVDHEGDACRSRIEVGGHLIAVEMTGLSAGDLVSREPTAHSPFHQQGIEHQAATATLTIDGTAIEFVRPTVGLTGGPPAVWAPAGLYAR